MGYKNMERNRKVVTYKDWKDWDPYWHAKDAKFEMEIWRDSIPKKLSN